MPAAYPVTASKSAGVSNPKSVDFGAALDFIGRAPVRTAGGGASVGHSRLGVAAWSKLSKQVAELGDAWGTDAFDAKAAELDAVKQAGLQRLQKRPRLIC